MTILVSILLRFHSISSRLILFFRDSSDPFSRVYHVGHMYPVVYHVGRMHPVVWMRRIVVVGSNLWISTELVYIKKLRMHFLNSNFLLIVTA